MLTYTRGELIYANGLTCQADIDGWRMEGDGAVSFPLGRMRMEGTRDPSEGQAANIVHWCDRHLPDNVVISWDFRPLHEPGLAILFFAARSRDGGDVMDPSLPPRSGQYEQYHHGAINALHVSYFRRKFPPERAFTTCNLRKSHGFHLVAQGADPIPSVPDAQPPYHIELVKAGPHVAFSIGQSGNPPIQLFHWIDDGRSTGPVLTEGKIGFRQMTPLIAEYANLAVHEARVE